jgi:hypothetical protein
MTRTQPSSFTYQVASMVSLVFAPGFTQRSHRPITEPYPCRCRMVLNSSTANLLAALDTRHFNPGLAVGLVLFLIQRPSPIHTHGRTSELNSAPFKRASHNTPHPARRSPFNLSQGARYRSPPAFLRDASPTLFSSSTSFHATGFLLENRGLRQRR